MEIKNYRLIKFLNLPEEEIIKTSAILRLLNPTPTKKRIEEFTLGEVEDMKDAFNTADYREIIHTIAMLEGVKDRKVLGFKIVKFFGLYNSVCEQIEKLYKRESDFLSPRHVDKKWEQIRGSERLAKFGIFNTLDRLADGDATKYDYFLNMKYSKIFTILYMKNVQDTLNSEMLKIK